MAIGGQGLPLPQISNQPTPYSLPGNYAVQPGSNVIAMATGNVLLIPPGWWYYDLGSYCYIAFRDSVSGWLYPTTYVPISSGLASTAQARTGVIESDGANFYIINPKGIPLGATVTGAGTGFTIAKQASIAVTPSTNSTDSVWHAIVGGTITSITIGNDSKGNTGGTNFTLAPTLIIGAPPPVLANLPSTAIAMGGVQAAATCTVSGGAINAVTTISTTGSSVGSGAGYSAAPVVQVVPNPLDPTLGSITIPTLTAVVGGNTGVTAVVLDYPGAGAGVPTLTITGGGGSSATATAAVGIATAASDTILLQWLGGSS